MIAYQANIEDATKIPPGIDAMMDAAREYREGHNWFIIPIKISEDGKKKPVCKYKTTPALSNDELGRLLRKPDVNGIAVHTEKSKIAVRDFDTFAAWDEFEQRHPKLAAILPRSRTRRGYHAYCRSDLSKNRHFSDGEYRGNGLAVLPPSAGLYAWVMPLPKGDLPFVHHLELFPKDIAEEEENMSRDGRSHSSAVSAISDISAHAPTPPTSLSIVDVIRMTLPTRPGERNNCLMKLARGVKFDLAMDGATNEQIKPILVEWHRQSLPVITTKDVAESWVEFLHAFKNARHPLTLDALDMVASRIDPEDLPEAAHAYADMPTIQKLIAICFELSKLHPQGQFFLSSHHIAPRLGLTPIGAWRLLKLLETDGVIAVAETGHEYRANRYTWIRKESE